MQAFGLLVPGVMLGQPFMLQPGLQADTPTSSADEADLVKKENVIKSPLAKHDQISAALPSYSEDSAAPAVDSPPAVDQPPTCTTATVCPAGANCAKAAFAPAAYAATATSSQQRCGPGPDPWLMGLFNVSLFDAHGCRCHPGIVRNGTLKKNENNQYCLQCTHLAGTAMCKLCLPDHSACCSGRVFQIRKYMYQTCVHVDDIQPLYDVSGVQAYCINSRRAVLIHPKNMEKEQKCPAFDHTCLGCHKPLRHDCTYCSLRCKVDVEFGFAPITPKGSVQAAVQRGSNSGGSSGSDPVAAAVAAVMAAAQQPQQAAASRLTATQRPAAAVAAAAPSFVYAEAPSLDVSHATRCTSDSSSSRSKRRKAAHPERSFLS